MKGDTRAELLLRYGAAFVAAIFTAAGMGCIVGWSSPALAYLKSPESHLNLTERERSWITPLLPVGQVIGYLLVPIAHKLMNEKWTLLLFSIPQLLSWFLIITAKNFLFFFVARLLGGLGYAGGLCSLTMYLTELSSQHNRGIFLAFVQLFQSVGFFFMILFDLYFHYYYMNIIIIGTMCCFVFVFICMPDSSYFKKEEIIGEEMVVLKGPNNWTLEAEELRLSADNLSKVECNSRRIEDIENGEDIEVSEDIEISEDIEVRKKLLKKEEFEAEIDIRARKKFIDTKDTEASEDIEDIGSEEKTKCKNGKKKEENKVANKEDSKANEAKKKINGQEEVKRKTTLEEKEDLKINENMIKDVKVEDTVKEVMDVKEEMKLKEEVKVKEVKANEEMKLKEVNAKEEMKLKEEIKLKEEMKLKKVAKIKEENEFNEKMGKKISTEANYKNAEGKKVKRKNHNLIGSKKINSLISKLKNSNFWKLMTVQTYRNAMLIVICVAAQEHFAGASVIKVFTQQIFKYTKSSMSLEEESLLLGFVKLIASLISINIIEKFPRKSVLTFTGLFGTLGLIIAGTIFFLESLSIDVASLSWLPIFGILLYDFMFTIGVTNFLYIYLGELFVGEIKSVAITVCKVICLIFIFINILLYQELSKILGIHVIFAIYAFNSIFLLSILMRITPETRGRSMNEIQILLKKKKLF